MSTSATVSFTATAGSCLLAADIVRHSIERGDWDEEFCDTISPTVGRLLDAANDAHDPGDTQAVTVTLDREVADELAAILGSDARAETALRPLLDPLEAALNS